MGGLRLFEKLHILFLLLPAFLLLFLLFGGGLLVGISQSLGYFPVIGLREVSFRYYIEVLSDRTFLQSLWLTFRIAFVSTLLSSILGLACALVLRERFRGSQLVSFLFQLPLPIPHLVAANGFVLLISQSGLLARIGVALGMMERPSDFPILLFDQAGVAIILTFLWKEVPFIGLVALAMLQSIGSQYEEVAQTLGANRWQRFRYVLLPLILPGILSTSIIVFAFVFASYEIPLLLGVYYPTTLPVLAFQHYQNPDLTLRPQAMAISIILTIIALILLVAYQACSKRFSASGL